MESAVFTIRKVDGRFNFTCKRYNTYNRYGVMFIEIYKTMEEITDVFNNVIGVGVTFEID